MFLGFLRRYKCHIFSLLSGFISGFYIINKLSDYFCNVEKQFKGERAWFTSVCTDHFMLWLYHGLKFFFFFYASILHFNAAVMLQLKFLNANKCCCCCHSIAWDQSVVM